MGPEPSRRTERFQDFDFYLSFDQKFGYHNLLIERYGYTISLKHWVEVQKIGLPEMAGVETIFDCFKHHEGWSLCISESTFLNDQQEIWSEKRDPLREELQFLSGPIESSMAAERRIAKLIVQEFDVDDQITKEIAKNRFAVGLGVRAFQRAWEQARSERPASGKAGKPKSKPRIDT